MEQNKEKRVEKGKVFLEHIWRALASRIVKLAGEHYKWNEEEWREAIDLYCRPGDYKVVIK